MATASIYWHKGRFLIPTEARTHAGFLVMIDPVHVLPEPSTEALSAVLSQVLSAGNPSIPTPDPDTLSRAVPEAAGVSSWAKFERMARLWNVRRDDKGTLVLVPFRRREDRGLEPIKDRAETFASVEDVARRVMEQATSVVTDH